MRTPRFAGAPRRDRVTYENILFETDGRLAFITLNRPEKLNALSNDLRGELFHALKEAEADRSVGVIVLRANGRAFSAGYDLSPSRAARDGSTPDRARGAR